MAIPLTLEPNLNLNKAYSLYPELNNVIKQYTYLSSFNIYSLADLTNGFPSLQLRLNTAIQVYL